MRKVGNHKGARARWLSFRRDRSGATAIEFAILLLPFCTILFFITEFSVFFFHKQYLKHVLYESSRNLQTGEIQQASNPEIEFQREVCEDARMMFDCDLVYYDVRSFSSIADVDLPDLEFNSAGKPTNTTFDPGAGEDVVAVRMTTIFNFFTPLMRNIFQPDGDPVISVGVSVAKSEPF